MLTQIETKLYLYKQNNSGGYFVQDDNVDIWIAIEARNEDEASERCIEATQQYFSCDCCGERFSHYYAHETIDAGSIENVIDVIKMRISFMRQELGERIFNSMYKNPCVIVHLFNGQKMRVEVGQDDGYAGNKGEG